MTPGADPYRDWDAAYVLGALGPAERRAYEQHLLTCDACRAGVAALAGMPGLLAALTPEQAAGLLREPEPGPDVLPLAGLAAAAQRSRARRRSLAGVAAAVLAIGGVLGGVALADGPTEPGPPAAEGSPSASGSQAGERILSLAPVGAADVSATLTATPTDWGTRLEWSCAYGDGEPDVDQEGYGSPVTYELVLVDGDGERTVVATWAATGSRSTGLGATSALRLDDLERVEIAVAGSGEPLASAIL